jgi:alginate O-acetyltransferase complex protein AlgJ
MAPEEGVARGERPPQGLRVAVAAAALLFFAAPLVLGLLGVSGGRVAGERAAARPSLSQGWDIFDAGTRWFAVHLPGRRRAVSANNWISREVFGTTPIYGATTADRSLPSGGVEPGSPQDPDRTGGADPGHPPVVHGRLGWTFLQGEIDRNCHPPIELDAALRRWHALVDAIRDSGRRVVLLVAPEKSTIYPELLGHNTINGDCALRNKARMWAAVEAVHDPDVVGLREPLLARKRASKQPLYLRVNSHWNDYGALELVRRALARVGGGVTVGPEELVRGRTRYASDLSPLEGKTSYDTTATLTITRDGAQEPFVHPLGSATVSTLPPSRVPTVAGTTLVVGDSFADAPLAMLRHYASRLVNVAWKGLAPTEFVRLVARADTVILEAVERSFVQLPSSKPPTETGSMVTPELVSRLRLLRAPATDRARAAPQR